MFAQHAQRAAPGFEEAVFSHVNHVSGGIETGMIKRASAQIQRSLQDTSASRHSDNAR